jgi:molybdopterin molybdotransferase
MPKKFPFASNVNEPKSLRDLSCADDYDPNSMPVERARAHIHSFLAPIDGTERVHVRAALNRVLAEDIRSPIAVPGHDNSAMDGYAIRYADLSSERETALVLAGSSFAGNPYRGAVEAGQAVRIMTGGVLPVGSDTVVMQEVARTADGRVIVPALAEARIRGPGANTRKAGEDLKAGSLALARGIRIHAAELGLIASLGIGEVSVYRRLRVAFFSTGDELRAIGQRLEAGEIYDSNRYTLYGMLTKLGCEVLDMGVIRDEPAAVERAFASAAESADVVITSGGVSVGEADYVKDVLDKLGEVLFWKIAMKPGRPLAYGKLGRAHFFGLPGNPVAVMVTFYQFVREALLVLSGQTRLPFSPTVQATLKSPIKKAPGRTEFQRGILVADPAGGYVVTTTGDQGSGILRSMSEANGLVVLHHEQGNVAAGEAVDVLPFDGLI